MTMPSTPFLPAGDSAGSPRDFPASVSGSGGVAGADAGPRVDGGLAGTMRPGAPEVEYRWTPGGDPQGPAEIGAFFHSPAIAVLKERMCDIGRRLWQREYTDGNGGNITIRVGDRLALCTPTLMCKGFMRPEDVCLVDFDGRHLAGQRTPTSETLTHFGIMTRQPAAKSCVHAHPPHATAFAIGHVEIPQYLIPEVEIFLGKIGIADYGTPGSAAYAALIGEAARDHQAVLMKNHGVMVWGNDIEDAYWKMENVDAYCRMIWIAAGLGGGLHAFSGRQAKELIQRRQRQGMTDLRAALGEEDLVNRTDLRRWGREREAGTAGAAPAPLTEAHVEVIVRAVTARVLQELGR